MVITYMYVNEADMNDCLIRKDALGAMNSSFILLVAVAKWNVTKCYTML